MSSQCRALARIMACARELETIIIAMTDRNVVNALRVESQGMAIK